MASNFSPWGLVGSGIGGAFQYAGAKKQAEAETQASQLQNQFNEKALAAAQDQQNWQRQQYANYVQRMQPYSNLGLSAGTTLSSLLGRSPYTGYAQTGAAPTPQSFTLPQSSIGTLSAKQ